MILLTDHYRQSKLNIACMPAYISYCMTHVTQASIKRIDTSSGNLSDVTTNLPTPSTRICDGVTQVFVYGDLVCVV